MKKIVPYLLIGIVLTAAVLLIFTGDTASKKKLDERMSFRKQDKIPYGAYVAYESLRSLFPRSSVSAGNNSPGNWDSLSFYDEGQALIIISPMFFADEFEMKKIIRFAEAGNDVFISTSILSEDAKNVMSFGISYVDVFQLIARKDPKDTLKVRLEKPVFSNTKTYRYPGKRFDTYFFRMDTSITTVLGTGRDVDTNFVHLKAGKGNLYLHLAPMTFTNYFLLRDDNIRYYEHILSVIPPGTKKIVWDEYYLAKRRSYNSPPDQDNKGWMSTLFEYPALKWALLTALFTLLVYALMEMRRKQRYIPVVAKPKNDSLDFVKTIGRLYYDKGDHKNLCRKMSAYFLEHVRNRYKLATGNLNDDFVRNLQFKTGIHEEEIRSIVYFIRDMETAPAITGHQLAHFHKQLESFYNKT
ncbi:MAG: DUF4350 domain-containing protein [Chitinophagaceae bacterium]|nr:DUF4350 domain-containing protein [Chitinophagaceae bacterium]